MVAESDGTSASTPRGTALVRRRLDAVAPARGVPSVPTPARQASPPSAAGTPPPQRTTTAASGPEMAAGAAAFFDRPGRASAVAVQLLDTAAAPHIGKDRGAHEASPGARATQTAIGASLAYRHQGAMPVLYGDRPVVFRVKV